MEPQETIRSFSAHIALQQSPVGFCQIHHDQGIHDIAEVPVDGEAEKFTPPSLR